MLTRVAGHDMEREGLGDACIPVYIKCVCKAELPSDYHGPAAW